MVNVWASWCVPCHDEIPFLAQLGKDTRIRLVGINYKDAPDNARRFLNRYGNPFVATGVDANGRRIQSNRRSHGVPETFVVGRDARRGQAGRPDQRRQSARRADAGDREGAGELVQRRHLRIRTPSATL